MKVLPILPFVLCGVLAAPASEEQTLLGAAIGYSDLQGGVLSEIAKGVGHIVHDTEIVVEKKVKQWFEGGKEFVKQNGLVCESAQKISSRRDT